MHVLTETNLCPPIVLGANDRLGSEVVRQALEASYRVTILVRSEQNLPFTRGQRANPNFVACVGSVLCRKTLDKVVEGQDAVVNCLRPRFSFRSCNTDLNSRTQQMINESMFKFGVRRLI